MQLGGAPIVSPPFLLGDVEARDLWAPDPEGPPGPHPALPFCVPLGLMLTFIPRFLNSSSHFTQFRQEKQRSQIQSEIPDLSGPLNSPKHSLERQSKIHI